MEDAAAFRNELQGYLLLAIAGENMLAQGQKPGIKLAVTTEYLVQARDSLGKAVYSSAYFNEYAEIYAYALIMVLVAVVVSEAPRTLAKGFIHASE